MSKREKAVPASYLILEKDGKILLGLRKNTGYFDDWYAVPSGHVEAGELPIACLVREAKEEIGVDIDPKSVKLIHTMFRVKHDETGPRADYFFTISNWSGEIENMEVNKCVKLEWFRIDNLPENTMPHVRLAVECYRKNIMYSELPFNKEFLNPNFFMARQVHLQPRSQMFLLQ